MKASYTGRSHTSCNAGLQAGAVQGQPSPPDGTGTGANSSSSFPAKVPYHRSHLQATCNFLTKLYSKELCVWCKGCLPALLSFRCH